MRPLPQLFLPLLLLIVAQNASAQIAAEPKGANFSADVNLVVLHATVGNRKGGFVSGLRQEDFRVFEDGQPQTIRLFQHEDVPVAAGLVVDNSGSMSSKRKDVTAAALAFVRSSNPHDQMFIFNFNEHVCSDCPTRNSSRPSPAELEAALNGVPATGKTALHDAILAGLDHLKKATLDKKVLIVVSDGGDNASHHTLAQILEASGRSDAIIYTIGLFDEYGEDSNPGVLKKIARATGGEASFPRRLRRLSRSASASRWIFAINIRSVTSPPTGPSTMPPNHPPGRYGAAWREISGSDQGGLHSRFRAAEPRTAEQSPMRFPCGSATGSRRHLIRHRCAGRLSRGLRERQNSFRFLQRGTSRRKSFPAVPQ